MTKSQWWIIVGLFTFLCIYHFFLVYKIQYGLNEIKTTIWNIETHTEYTKHYTADIYSNIPSIKKGISDIYLYVDEIDDVLNDKFYWHWNITKTLLSY